MVAPVVVLERAAEAYREALGSDAARDWHRQRVAMGGVLIDRVDSAAAVARIHHFLRSDHLHQIVTVNLDFVTIAQRDAAFRETINGADLAVADGMPLVWVSRLMGLPLAERITGVELVDASCQIAAAEERGVFLLGAAPDITARAAAAMQARYPGLRVVGTCSPPFGALQPEQDARIVAQIQDAAPDFLFVAMGAPRQDLWIRAHREQLPVPVAMGVGCVFDLLAGAVQRAPTWMQRGGLEWSFRLLQEPSRLWRRYFVDDMPTLGRLVLAALRKAEHEAPTLIAARPANEPPVERLA